MQSHMRALAFSVTTSNLLGELHRERERLSLPRLGKYRLALVSRLRLKTLVFQNRIRRTQGSRPTCRDTRHRAMRLAPPTAF
jgi:hypothetical protein